MAQSTEAGQIFSGRSQLSSTSSGSFCDASSAYLFSSIYPEKANFINSPSPADIFSKSLGI